MSENTTSQLTPAMVESMKYNELKSKAAELGLDASGTKEDLTARIVATLGGSNAPAEGGDESNKGDESGNADGGNAPAPAAPAPEAPQEAPNVGLSETQERVEQSKADTALRQSAREMKAALDKQPKVSIMIPFEAGENPEQGKQVPFHCNLNGYAMDLPRGQYIEVPKQIAELIKERLESEGKIGSQWRVDRDARKQVALS